MMHKWDELHTAYQVARLGTVSAAAEALGIHRATVIRHVDSLEAELGTKLFQRHSRGYTMTDVGEELLEAASIAESQFLQFKARAVGRNELQGEFIVTSLEFIPPLLMPILKTFQAQHPKLQIHYLTSESLFKLEYGQAHIAIRTGPKPDHPDYVVKPFINYEIGLFAHRGYVERYGTPEGVADFPNHHFICTNNQKARPAIQRWVLKHAPESSIVLRSNSQAVQHVAIQSQLGIGVMLKHEAEALPDIVQVFPSKPNWQVQNWLVTHADLHRSEKVQEFLKLLEDSQ